MTAYSHREDFLKSFRSEISGKKISTQPFSYPTGSGSKRRLGGQSVPPRSHGIEGGNGKRDHTLGLQGILDLEEDWGDSKND